MHVCSPSLSSVSQILLKHSAWMSQIIQNVNTTVSVHWERFQENKKFLTQYGVTVVLINSKVNIFLSVKLYQRKSKLLYICKYTFYFRYHIQMPFDLPALTLLTTWPLIWMSSARHRALNLYIYIYKLCKKIWCIQQWFWTHHSQTYRSQFVNLMAHLGGLFFQCLIFTLYPM